MTMRKTDYEAIAAAINDTRSPVSDCNIVTGQFRKGVNTAMDEVAGRVSRYCASRDPQFQRAKFLKLCGIETGE